MDLGSRLPLFTSIFFLFGANVTTTGFSIGVDGFDLSKEIILHKGDNISMVFDFTTDDKDSVLDVSVRNRLIIVYCFYEFGYLKCMNRYALLDRYTITVSQASMIINITNIQVSDGGYWQCERFTGYNISIWTLTINVLAPPTGLVLMGSSKAVDLSRTGTEIICKTLNCVHPRPGNFQWFYKEANSWNFFKNSTPTESHASSSYLTCSREEGEYISSLNLVINTVWPIHPSNAEKEVKFQCRLHFDTLKTPLRSIESNEVRFAVMVTSVSLRVDDKALSNFDRMTMVFGTSSRFSCVTSHSRPTATIVWYIGSSVQQKNKSTEFYYNPKYADNDKQIYCKAFNIQKEENAVSSNAAILHVFDKARISSFLATGITNETVKVNESDRLQLECSVESNTSSRIEIQFEDKILMSQENTMNLTYNLEYAKCIDTGLYRCSAQNEYNYGKYSEKELKVYVLCSPRPVYSDQWNYTTALYDAVTLTFTSLAYPEPGKKGFTWYKKNNIVWTKLLDNADLQIRSSGLQSNLTIQKVTESDYGYYRVTATNEIGIYHQYLTLLTKEKGKTDTTQDLDDRLALIVGIVLGLAIIATTALYVVIVKLKRKSHPTEESGKQTDNYETQNTYGNISYQNDVQEPTESDAASG